MPDLILVSCHLLLGGQESWTYSEYPSLVFLLFLLGGVRHLCLKPSRPRLQDGRIQLSCLTYSLLIESVKWPYLEIMTYHLPLTEWAQSLPEWESAPKLLSSSPAMSDVPVSTLTLQRLASSLFLESHSLIFVLSSHICGTHLQAVASQIMCLVCLLACWAVAVTCTHICL